MTNVLLVFGAVVLFFVATNGWGRLASAPLGGEITPPFFFSSALGIAVWIFLGGVLNVAELAFPLALDAIVLAGLGLSVSYELPRLRRLVRDFVFPSKPITLNRFSPGRLVTTPFLFAILSVALIPFLYSIFLVPSHVFNYHDDFHKYFHHPLRMLAVGSLAENPFDTVGIETLGGQAFLQSFIVQRFSVIYINGFDSVFCLILCLFLIYTLGRRLEVPIIYIWAAFVALILIDPWIINISAAYSATAMILGLFYVSIDLIEKPTNDGLYRLARPASAAGLFLAAILALKGTFVFFVIIYGFVLWIFLLFFNRDKNKAMMTGLVVSLVAAVGLLPWAVLSRHEIGAVVRRLFAERGSYAVGLDSGTSGLGQLFSFERAHYGGSYGEFTIVGLILVVLAVMAALTLLARKERQNSLSVGPILLLLVVSIDAVGTYLTNVWLVPRTISAVRYALPVLIAALPVAILISARYSGVLQNRQRSHPSATMTLRHGASPLAILILLVALFGDSLFLRLARAQQYGTTVSFPFGNDYARYNAEALAEAKRQLLINIQTHTPEGHAILAWISTPFHLDFKRNDIYVAHAAGITSATARMQWLGDSDALHAYLANSGILYVMWERVGYGVWNATTLDALVARDSVYRGLARTLKQFTHALERLEAASLVVYDDGQIVLFEIDAQKLSAVNRNNREAKNPR
jgi:hypothetical protein